MDHWEGLHLTTLDACRTTIVSSKKPERPIYTITTDETGSKLVTTFTDAAGNAFAGLEWHLHFSDKLAVRGGEKLNVSKWLKSKKLREASFTDAEGHTCT
ncbi:hypothetical protein ACEPAI_8176 [Sanghuangporus weigelae]